MSAFRILDKYVDGSSVVWHKGICAIHHVAHFGSPLLIFHAAIEKEMLSREKIFLCRPCVEGAVKCIHFIFWSCCVSLFDEAIFGNAAGICDNAHEAFFVCGIVGSYFEDHGTSSAKPHEDVFSVERILEDVVCGVDYGFDVVCIGICPVFEVEPLDSNDRALHAFCGFHFVVDACIGGAVGAVERDDGALRCFCWGVDGEKVGTLCGGVYAEVIRVDIVNVRTFTCPYAVRVVVHFFERAEVEKGLRRAGFGCVRCCGE